MPELLRYALSFPDGLHVSSGGFAEESAEEFIRSDTLFSALCSASALLFGEQGPRTFLEDPDFVLSSAFPRIGDDCFFPVPADLGPGAFKRVEDNSAEPVPLRHVNWVCEDIFQSILAGSREIRVRSAMQNLASSKVHSEERWATRVEVPRVSVDRVTSTGQIFHFSEIRFHPDAGLHFLVNPGRNETRNVFEASLHLLADEGIGADRSMGKGWFEYRPIDIPFEDPPGNAEARLLLSLYQPTAEEFPDLDLSNSHYTLLSRRGWVTSPTGATLRRASARAFAEGSVLSLRNAVALRGATPCLLPMGSGNTLAHNVYRSFRGFSVGYRLSSTSR